MSYDLHAIRQQFAILGQRVYGHPLVYLDSAATAQKPERVLNACTDTYRLVNSNIHRGVHHLSNVCTERYEAARHTLARHIGAPDDCVVMLRNTTEAVNLVANAWGNDNVGEGDTVLVSAMEHHSNLVPWQLLCQRRRATLKVMPILDNGDLDLDALPALFELRPKLVALTAVSNVTGAVNDLNRVIALAREAGTRTFIDAAQWAPHHSIDVAALGCDFLAFSGHKLYGPLGSGVLYAKKELLEVMPPWMGGGEMIDHVSFERTTYAPPPLRFEAGTPDYVAAIGLAEAVRFVHEIGFEALERHEAELLNALVEGLNAIPGVRLIGTPARRSGVVSFLLHGAHPYDVGALLDKMGVAVRTGHHCAEPLMATFRIPGTVRASVACYTSTNDIQALLTALEKAKKLLGV